MTHRGNRYSFWKVELLAVLLAAASLLPHAQAADAPARWPAIYTALLQNLTPTGVNIIMGGGDTVEYGLAAEKLDKSVQPPAETPGRLSITGLEPGKTYYYRLLMKSPDGKQTIYSETNSFTTPPSDVTKFSFAVIADSHTSPCNRDLAKLMMEIKPDFVLNGGDRAPSINSGTLVPYRNVFSHIPMYMARGNHDVENKQKQFSMMPGPGDNQYFSFTWGNARFICVNSEDRNGSGLKKGGTQYNWLEGELKNCKQTWKIVFQHIPVLSAYDGGYRPELTEERDLLEQYGVDLVFQGHQHNYDRSKPMKDGKPAADGKGVIYDTCSGACGGKEKFPKGTNLPFLAKTYNEGPFLGMVYIDGNKLKFECLGPDKKLIDSLELQAR